MAMAVLLTCSRALGYACHPFGPSRAHHALATTTTCCCSARAPYTTDQCELSACQTTSSGGLAAAWPTRSRCAPPPHSAEARRGARYSSPRAIFRGTSATVAYACVGLLRMLRSTPTDVAPSGALPTCARGGVDTTPGALYVPQELQYGPVSGPRARPDHRSDKLALERSCARM